MERADHELTQTPLCKQLSHDMKKKLGDNAHPANHSTERRRSRNQQPAKNENQSVGSEQKQGTTPVEKLDPPNKSLCFPIRKVFEKLKSRIRCIIHVQLPSKTKGDSAAKADRDQSPVKMKPSKRRERTCIPGAQSKEDYGVMASGLIEDSTENSVSGMPGRVMRQHIGNKGKPNASHRRDSTATPLPRFARRLDEEIAMFTANDVHIALH